jgi:hypothetical protein
MTDILDKYTKEQLKDFVNSDKCIPWPDDFREWITEDMAYEVFDRWCEGHDDDDFYDLAKSILSDILDEDE